MASPDSPDMQRTSMINKVGCIAVALFIILVVVIGIAATHTSLAGKRKAAEKELDALKNIVVSGLDFPRPLGRYVRGEAGFDAVMSEIDALKPRIESAATLSELEPVYEEYKLKSHEIRRMIDPVLAEDQAVRNQEAQIDGIFNRWRIKREEAVVAINRYNQALEGGIEKFIGSLFGMKEMPINAATSQGGER